MHSHSASHLAQQDCAAGQPDSAGSQEARAENETTQPASQPAQLACAASQDTQPTKVAAIAARHPARAASATSAAK